MMAVRSILSKIFAHDIEGIEPSIVELAQPLKIIGLSIDTDVRRVYRDVPGLGKELERYKGTHQIPNRKEPWAFAAVSKDFDEEKRTFTYIIGDVVTSLEEVPAGLIPFEIPAIKYAVFPIRPKNRFGWGMAIAHAKRYAYSVWLPNSHYEGAGIIDDFEYHDERSVRKQNPEIDLYVAIKEK